MNPKAIEDAMKKDAAGRRRAPWNPRASPAVTASPDAVPPLGRGAAEQPAKVKELMRFTVRNEVLHGPVLGLSGFGIARVNSHLVMSDETRKKITEIFGPKDPLEVSTRVGFLGGGTTTFTSEGRTIKPDDGKAEISWETSKLAIGYSRDADSYDMDGKWPKLEVKSLEDKAHFVMNDMTLDGDGKRVRGDLYDGDFTLKIASMSVRRPRRRARSRSLDLHYIVEVATKDDFTSMSAKFGTGAL